MIWFDRQAAQDLTATLGVQLLVGRRRQPLAFGMHVDNGQLRMRHGTPSQPDASVTMHARDLFRLALGEVGWPQLLAAGRLELTGDPFLALRFPGLFRLPAASAPRRHRRRAA